MTKKDWHPMSESPKKTGAYLVFTLSADPKSPLRYIAFYWKEKLVIGGEVLQKANTWEGLVEPWMKVLSHWAEFPPDPVNHKTKRGK